MTDEIPSSAPPRRQADAAQIEQWLDGLALAVPAIRGPGVMREDHVVTVKGQQLRLAAGAEVLVAYSKADRTCVWVEGAPPLVVPGRLVEEKPAEAPRLSEDEPGGASPLRANFMSWSLFHKISALVVKLFDVQQQLIARKAVEARKRRGSSGSNLSPRKSSGHGSPRGPSQLRDPEGATRASGDGRSPKTPSSKRVAEIAEEVATYGLNHSEGQESFEG